MQKRVSETRTYISTIEFLLLAIFQNLAAKGELPEFMSNGLNPMMPALGVGGGFMGGSTPLALPDSDPEKEESAFMGDLLAICPEECQDILNRNMLKSIASAMVEKGWRRI